MTCDICEHSMEQHENIPGLTAILYCKVPWCGCGKQKQKT